MPRIPRVKSATGIYHIMVRGIDKRNIFLDDQDRAKFLEKLCRAKKTAGLSYIELNISTQKLSEFTNEERNQK